MHACMCVCARARARGGGVWGVQSGLWTLQILQPSITLHPHHGEQGPVGWARVPQERERPGVRQPLPTSPAYSPHPEGPGLADICQLSRPLPELLPWDTWPGNQGEQGDASLLPNAGCGHPQPGSLCDRKQDNLGRQMPQGQV